MKAKSRRLFNNEWDRNTYTLMVMSCQTPKEMWDKKCGVLCVSSLNTVSNKKLYIDADM